MQAPIRPFLMGFGLSVGAMLVPLVIIVGGILAPTAPINFVPFDSGQRLLAFVSSVWFISAVLAVLVGLPVWLLLEHVAVLQPLARSGLRFGCVGFVMGFFGGILTTHTDVTVSLMLAGLSLVVAMGAWHTLRILERSVRRS